MANGAVFIRADKETLAPRTYSVKEGERLQHPESTHSARSGGAVFVCFMLKSFIAASASQRRAAAAAAVKQTVYLQRASEDQVIGLQSLIARQVADTDF